MASDPGGNVKLLCLVFAVGSLGVWGFALGANHYEVLGVFREASRGDIYRAYEAKLAEAERSGDQQKEKEIRDAFDVLMSKREKYDLELAEEGAKNNRLEIFVQKVADLDHELKAAPPATFKEVLLRLAREADAEELKELSRRKKLDQEVRRRSPKLNPLPYETEAHLLMRKILARNTSQFLTLGPNVQEIGTVISSLEGTVVMGAEGEGRRPHGHDEVRGGREASDQLFRALREHPATTEEMFRRHYANWLQLRGLTDPDRSIKNEPVKDWFECYERRFPQSSAFDLVSVHLKAMEGSARVFEFYVGKVNPERLYQMFENATMEKLMKVADQSPDLELELKDERHFLETLVHHHPEFRSRITRHGGFAGKLQSWFSAEARCRHALGLIALKAAARATMSY